ncbi:hypothetical protein HY250_04750 [Candidatus Azambacteria bacterium]|nr:hypothetical protein [Candidatus Azambacteria bacterium]
MKAFVAGNVINNDSVFVYVQCENGKIVRVIYDDIDLPDTMPRSFAGFSIEIDGHAIFSDGDIDIYAEEMRLWDKERYLGGYSDSVIAAAQKKQKESLSQAAGSDETNTTAILNAVRRAMRASGVEVKSLDFDPSTMEVRINGMKFKMPFRLNAVVAALKQPLPQE